MINVLSCRSELKSLVRTDFGVIDFIISKMHRSQLPSRRVCRTGVVRFNKVEPIYLSTYPATQNYKTS